MTLFYLNSLYNFRRLNKNGRQKLHKTLPEKTNELKSICCKDCAILIFPHKKGYDNREKGGLWGHKLQRYVLSFV